jgi:hypothetical protein
LVFPANEKWFIKSSRGSLGCSPPGCSGDVFGIVFQHDGY